MFPIWQQVGKKKQTAGYRSTSPGAVSLRAELASDRSRIHCHSSDWYGEDEQARRTAISGFDTGASVGREAVTITITSSYSTRGSACTGRDPASAVQQTDSLTGPMPQESSASTNSPEPTRILQSPTIPFLLISAVKYTGRSPELQHGRLSWKKVRPDDYRRHGSCRFAFRRWLAGPASPHHSRSDQPWLRRDAACVYLIVIERWR